MTMTGQEMYELAGKLFPICRSITGNGVRESLKVMSQHVPGLDIHEVPTGYKAFDWVVPREWNISDAFVLDPAGRKIIDFADSNLHVVGYSTPIDQEVSLDDLRAHLHSLPNQPDAIPYITSYYKERWGFCITDNQRQTITQEGPYRVVIRSELRDGHLTYAELKIPGERQEEVFLSTYICHPSMANNELSGPVVAAALAGWIRSRKRKYSYRLIIIPETIGSIVYLSKNIEQMKRLTIAGFNITCVGDNRCYSYLPSRKGDSLADRVSQHVLKHLHPDYIRYSFLERGSDERQYCSPGVDLPVSSVMRSKFGTYPEYHTSLDDLSLISPDGLQGSFDVLRQCLQCIEENETLRVSVLCEPQLGPRGLYPTLSTKKSGEEVRDMMNVIAFSDGNNSLLDIAEMIGVPMWDLSPIVKKLKDAHILRGADEGEIP